MTRLLTLPRILLITLNLLLISCLPPPGYGNLTLHNNATVSIDEFYFTPSSSASWGPDQLGGPLAPSSTLTLYDIPVDWYDAMAVVVGTFSTYYSYAYDVQVIRDTTTHLYATDSGFTGSLEIRNIHATATIIELYVVPSSAPTWGTDQLTAAIGPGGSIELTDLPPGSYDILAIWDAGPNTELYNESIQSLTLLSIDVS